VAKKSKSKISVGEKKLKEGDDESSSYPVSVDSGNTSILYVSEKKASKTSDH